MLQKVDIALVLAVTPTVRVWSRKADSQVLTLPDGTQTPSQAFERATILGATPARLVRGGQTDDVEVQVALDGVLDTALADDIGSPAAQVYWLSGQAGAVDFHYEGVVDQVQRLPNHQAIITITSPAAWLLPVVATQWSDPAQQARYPGDPSMEYMARLAAQGLPAILTGDPALT